MKSVTAYLWSVTDEGQILFKKLSFFYEIRDGLPIIRDGWGPNSL